MTNKTEHHLEQAEHASHIAHDPFNQRITVTIAITAAILACTTMLGHRAHTEMLALQLQSSEAFMRAANERSRLQTASAETFLKAFNDRSRLQTASSQAFMKATNQWNYFQAKKNRQYLYESLGTLARLVASKPGPGKDDQSWQAEVKKEIENWRNESNRYKTETEAIQKDAEQFTNRSEKAARESDETFEAGADKAEKHNKEAEQTFQAGSEEAKKYHEESEKMHHLGNRYDLAELGVELGLVLCSLALITRNRNFWYSGMVCAAVGAVIAIIGVVHQYILH
jgi:hypothetical protein